MIKRITTIALALIMFCAVYAVTYANTISFTIGKPISILELDDYNVASVNIPITAEANELAFEFRFVELNTDASGMTSIKSTPPELIEDGGRIVQEWDWGKTTISGFDILCAGCTKDVEAIIEANRAGSYLLGLEIIATIPTDKELTTEASQFAVVSVNASGTAAFEIVDIKLSKQIHIQEQVSFEIYIKNIGDQSDFVTGTILAGNDEGSILQRLVMPRDTIVIPTTWQPKYPGIHNIDITVHPANHANNSVSSSVKVFYAGWLEIALALIIVVILLVEIIFGKRIINWISKRKRAKQK